MDAKITAFIESLVAEVLQIPDFASLSEAEKNEVAEKMRDRVNDITLNTLLDRLNLAQLQEIQDLSADNPQLAQKLQEFASKDPFLAEEVEKQLLEEVKKIKANPSGLR